jgi:basic amino acid/polyamine antiporter, APA family
LFAREATGLVKSLSAKDSLVINLSFINLEVIYLLYVFTGLYPGANIIYGLLFAALGTIVITLLYMFLTLAIPRTGADYVWVGRIIHPSIGLAVNFFYTVITLSLISVNGQTFASVFLGSGFTSAAIITGNSYYANIANTINQPWVIYVIAAIPLLLLLGVKNVTKIMWFSFICGVITFPIVVGSLLAAGHDGFVNTFNSLSGTTYQGVLSTASSSGFNTGVTALGVVFASIYAFNSIIGTQSNAYFVGEMKNARRIGSQAVAMIGSLLVYIVIAATLYLTVYAVLGTDFYSSVLYLFNNNPGNYTLAIGLPSPIAFLAYTTSNPTIPILVSILVSIALIGAVLALPFLAVRNIFAWSFDRVVPEKFAAVDKRGNPWAAILLVFVIAEIYAYVSTLLPLGAYLTYAVTGVLIVWVVVGLSAIILPYRRKEIFNAAPEIVRRKILGISSISLIGVLAVLMSAGVAIATLLPSYSGPTNPAYLADMLGAWLFGIPIYYISRYIRRRQGIRIDLAFKEIPPE